jgi:hypothetical protein
MARPQHGRKPQKAWHRRSEARRKFAAAEKAWPAEPPPVEYDGAPQPLRQKRPRGKSRRGLG